MNIWPINGSRPRIVDMCHPKTRIKVTDKEHSCIQILFEDRHDAFILITNRELASKLYLALTPLVADQAAWLKKHEPNA